MLLYSGIAQSHQERRSASPSFVQSWVLLAVLLALIYDTESYRTAERPYRILSFLLDNSDLAEMEFYLAADLECDLTIFHPTTPKEVSWLGTDNGPRYWGIEEGQFKLPEDAIHLARSARCSERGRAD